MFSKVYKAIYHQQWYRNMLMTGHWRTMRMNPSWYPDKQRALSRVYGVRGACGFTGLSGGALL